MASKCTQFCKYSKIKVYCFLIQGPKFKFGNPTRIVIKDLHFTEIGQLSKAVCLEIKILSQFLYARIFRKLRILYQKFIYWWRCTSGCNRALMQDTLPEEQSLSWRCLGFSWRDSPNNSHLSLYVNLLKTLYGCLTIILAAIVQLFLNIHPPLHVRSL